MRILAFDTSTSWCSVAVGDERGFVDREEPMGNAHSERLLPIVRDLVAECGFAMAALDAVAFGAGPGSFTGVRIACSVAQGLAMALDRPAIGISTLEAIAQHAYRMAGVQRALVCTDARMGEVYTAAYEQHGTRWRELTAPAVLNPVEVRLPADARSFVGTGNGFAAYPALGERLELTHVMPDARATGRSVAELALPRLAAGEGVDAAHALPLYVRHRVALTTAERDAGLRL